MPPSSAICTSDSSRQPVAFSGKPNSEAISLCETYDIQSVTSLPWNSHEYRTYRNSRFCFEYSEGFFHPTVHQHITNELKHQRAWYRLNGITLRVDVIFRSDAIPDRVCEKLTTFPVCGT
jgi:hypothetical protein